MQLQGSVRRQRHQKILHPSRFETSCTALRCALRHCVLEFGRPHNSKWCCPHHRTHAQKVPLLESNERHATAPQLVAHGYEAATSLQIPSMPHQRPVNVCTSHTTTRLHVLAAAASLCCRRLQSRKTTEWHVCSAAHIMLEISHLPTPWCALANRLAHAPGATAGRGVGIRRCWGEGALWSAAPPPAAPAAALCRGR